MLTTNFDMFLEKNKLIEINFGSSNQNWIYISDCNNKTEVKIVGMQPGGVPPVVYSRKLRALCRK
jgi:hypothetical protein